MTAPSPGKTPNCSKMPTFENVLLPRLCLNREFEKYR